MLREVRRRGHRVVLVATAAVLVIIGGVVLLHGAGADHAGPKRSDGPLDLPPAWSMTTIPISMTETAVWGHVVVTNRGADDITLTSAELLPAAGSGNRQTVSAFAAGPERDLYAIGADRVLPKLHTAPLAGTVVPATAAGKDRGVDVIFQVRPSRPGRVVYDRVRITYRSGGQSYEEQTPQGLTVCAAETRPRQGACTAETAQQGVLPAPNP